MTMTPGSVAETTGKVPEPDRGRLGDIVVGVDGSPGAARALDWAGAEAERAGARLTVLAGCLQGGYGATALLEESGQRIVDQAAQRIGDEHPGVAVVRQLQKRSPAEALIDASRGADLLVVGSRGWGGFRGLLLGSVGQHCLVHAECPVAVIRPSGDGHPDHSSSSGQSIVVGVDGSQDASRAVDWAVNEARRSGARLDVVGSGIFPSESGPVFGAAVADPDGAEQVVADALTGVARTAPEVATRGFTCESPPAVALVAASKSADLVVVGSRGLGAFRGLLLGSVSQHLANHAHSPVVVVRSNGSG